MKNCIILGSGRSGTSLTAGLLSRAGYYMGDEIMPARDANPKGFFESQEINDLNEDIIKLVTPQRLKIRKWEFFNDRPAKYQRWLSRIPLSTEMKRTPEIERRIFEKIQQQPYCFKDPRFSYTLPIWRPFLENTVYIVVFRHPYSTAQSILKECREADYLRDLKINMEQVLEGWQLMYEHIFKAEKEMGGEWLYIHYEQILNGEAFLKIEKTTQSKIYQEFVEKKLYRNQEKELVPSYLSGIYHKLCKKADYKLEMCPEE